MDAGIVNEFVYEVMRRTPAKTGNSLIVSSGTASITTADDHGLSVGDKVIVYGLDNELLDGFSVVADTPALNIFTFDAEGIADGADTNNPNINYFKTDVEVIIADSYSAAPAKPYITVKVTSDKEQGRVIPETESISSTEVNHLTSTYNIAAVELQFYSNSNTGEFSSQNLAKYFINATGFSRSAAFQMENDFGILNPGVRRNMDIAMGDLIERRTIVEFTVNYVYTIKDLNVPFINADGVIITVTQEN